MFTLEGRPNPLAMLASSFVNTGLSNYMQKQKEAEENKQIDQIFGDISPQTSPLEMIQRISKVSNPDKRKTLLESFKVMKQMQSEKSSQDVLDRLLKKKGAVEPSEGEEDSIASQYNEDELLQLLGNKTTAPIAKELLKIKDTEKKMKTEEEKKNEKKFQADREFHSKRSDPVIEEANKILQVAPERKALMEQQRRDIRSGNTSGILPFLADATGMEFYRNPESARFRTAAKARYIENLTSMGTNFRFNQFLEQQVADALARIGRGEEANETVLDMEEFIDDMKEQRAKVVRELAKEDRNKYDYVKSDISERADEKLAEYADKRKEEMAFTIRKRHEDEKNDEQLLKEIVMGDIPSDTPLTKRMASLLMIKNNDDPKKAYAEAKKLGFRIPE